MSLYLKINKYTELQPLENVKTSYIIYPKRKKKIELKIIVQRRRSQYTRSVKERKNKTY